MTTRERITVSDVDWFRCAWCWRSLPRERGQTRFDLFGSVNRELEFVCADSCETNRRRAEAASSATTTGVQHDRRDEDAA